MKKNTIWYIKRLLRMNHKEVVYRVIELIYIYKDYYMLSKSKNSNKDIKIENFCELSKRINDNPSLFFNEDSFGFKTLYINNTYDNVFVKKIEYSGTDFRAIWDSTRFNNLIELSSDNEDIYPSFEAFVNENPYLKGVNYISTMECAIRCINLYVSLLSIVGSYNTVDHKQRLAYGKFFKDNLTIIRNRLSKFSSRGNHTLFEYAGCYICCISLGYQNDSEKWLVKFRDEVSFQVNGDGSGIEQSTHYHVFNVELILLMQELSGEEIISRELKDNIFKFLKCISLKDNYIRFGDSDSSALCTHKSLLRTVRELNFKGNNDFRDTGLFCDLRINYKILVKYGSLGMKPLFGHGHYDFLSMCISRNNKLITADSMTYLYSASSRSDYRSVMYHSMPFTSVDIDQTSAFSWSKNARGVFVDRLSDCDFDKYSFEYDNSVSGMISRVVYCGDSSIIIIDSISKGEHTLNVNWVLQKGNSKYIRLFDSNYKSINFDIQEIEFSERYGRLDSIAERILVNDKRLIITVFDFSPDKKVDINSFINNNLKTFD